MASGRGGEGLKFSLRNGPVWADHVLVIIWPKQIGLDIFLFLSFLFSFSRMKWHRGWEMDLGGPVKWMWLGCNMWNSPKIKKYYFGEKYAYYKIVTVEFTNDISSSERDSVWQLVLLSKSVNLYLNRSLKRMEEESHRRHRKGYFKKNTANASTSVKIIFISSK